MLDAKKLTMQTWRVHYEPLNSGQPQKCECVMEKNLESHSGFTFELKPRLAWYFWKSTRQKLVHGLASFLEPRYFNQMICVVCLRKKFKFDELNLRWKLGSKWNSFHCQNSHLAPSKHNKNNTWHVKSFQGIIGLVLTHWDNIELQIY